VAATTGWLVYSHTGGEHAVAWRDLSGTIPNPRLNKRKVVVDRDGTETVLIALGPRSSTGYDLRIVRVVERRRSIEVVARERTPALGERVEPRLTYPYRLIGFRSIDKPVHVELEGRP
jgi:PrcB C-terminal